ncbi:recQ-mediated genome instability protein 1 [Dorcoceras hygrometricum]|uniref:RecQ-mediated genome instability protein 1 n=1 Tax=Dorcoceras hygrometricum TaxID=472368 RepID=A0A2Z7A932_9LAMI|nr:recQ-mediated genome instability protein 1 [Dorcoceras hygrometricum]
MQHAINQCYECMRAIKESDSETRSVNPSQLGGRHSNPVVTTPMIALDFSGTTTQSASHNVALNQVVNQSANQSLDGTTELTANATSFLLVQNSRQKLQGTEIQKLTLAGEPTDYTVRRRNSFALLLRC